MVGEEKVIVVEKDTYPEDLLSRQAFVDKMVDVTEIIASNKKNICYALNGRWGVGKSFVLDMFERYAKEKKSKETALNKYFLFHYNCWEYDYYEEPLVAIVSSMLDEIEEQEKLLSDELNKGGNRRFFQFGPGPHRRWGV